MSTTVHGTGNRAIISDNPVGMGQRERVPSKCEELRDLVEALEVSVDKNACLLHRLVGPSEPQPICGDSEKVIPQPECELLTLSTSIERLRRQINLLNENTERLAQGFQL